MDRKCCSSNLAVCKHVGRQSSHDKIMFASDKNISGPETVNVGVSFQLWWRTKHFRPPGLISLRRRTDREGSSSITFPAGYNTGGFRNDDYSFTFWPDGATSIPPFSVLTLCYLLFIPRPAQPRHLRLPLLHPQPFNDALPLLHSILYTQLFVRQL